MTPEEIAGCFLHYQDYFNGIKRNVAITGLNRLLDNPSDQKAMSIITVSSAPDYGVQHEGYHKAAEAYKSASSETQEKIKKLMKTGEKSKLIEKIQHFMTPDPDRVESEAKKEQERKDLDDYRERLKQEKADAAKKAQSKASGPESAAPATEPQTTLPTQSVPQAESTPAPQRTSEPQSSQIPATFKTMFENVTFKNEYQTIKNLSIAQKLHLYHDLREEQIRLLDMIEKALLADNKMSDADHAQVFYSVLSLAQNNLKHEFRWTALLGFPRQSRLEDIIQKHLEALSTSFPDIKPQTNKEQLKALLVEKALTSIEQHVDKLLKPHGLLQAMKAFIKEGLLHMSQPPKGPTHRG